MLNPTGYPVKSVFHRLSQIDSASHLAVRETPAPSEKFQNNTDKWTGITQDRRQIRLDWIVVGEVICLMWTNRVALVSTGTELLMS